MNQKIVLVEDDDDIREIALYALHQAGFEARGFESGESLLASPFLADLYILDIMLPGESGLEILKKIRGQNANVPVIMLTAKGSEYDKVKGLDLGADDYITKPFGVMELISRIKALLRRSGTGANGNMNYENISIDHAKRQVTADGEPVHLTFKEYELLHYLMTNKEIALSRDKIIETVWDYDFEGESRTVDMHIKSLRQKLGAAGTHIKTLRGVGYKLGE
ncbi:MAG: response regulator transcription factor [Defluviitaleaceae bacterium]|nr:response regulator transcription factor [Defluviitaleaceae bacterium]